MTYHHLNVAAEIKEILSSAERSRNGNEECDAVMKSIFLHHINNFYSRYLYLSYLTASQSATNK